MIRVRYTASDRVRVCWLCTRGQGHVEVKRPFGGVWRGLEGNMS